MLNTEAKAEYMKSGLLGVERRRNTEQWKNNAPF